MLSPLLEPDNRVFLGMGGEGKSHLARHQSWTVASRVIICDPNAEPAWASGAMVVDHPADLCQLLKEPEARLCWRGFDHMGEEAAFLWANRAALAAGDTLIIWDEVDFFYPYIKPDTPPYRVWNAGRHQRVRCFAIARSALAVPRTLTRNATSVCAFVTAEPSDIKYLAGTPRAPGLIGIEAATAVQGLKPGSRQCVHWRRGGGWQVRKSPFL